MPDEKSHPGLLVHCIAESVYWSELLEQQYLAIVASGMANRPWMFWELHNPWSRAACNVDSWQLLDICQSPALLDCLAGLIGTDIVLFDSQIVPNPALAQSCKTSLHNDSHFFPLDEDGGIVVRLPFRTPDTRTCEFRHRDTGTLDYSIGQILVHDASVDYRLTCGASASDMKPGFEYVIRYFPADRHYERDPGHPRQVILTDRYPWVNYAKMPLWLVRGEDRAGNDFVTGFHTRTGRWTTAIAR